MKTPQDFIELVRTTIVELPGLKPHMKLAHVRSCPHADNMLVATFIEKHPPGILSKVGAEWLLVYISISDLLAARNPARFVETLVRHMHDSGLQADPEYADEPLI